MTPTTDKIFAGHENLDDFLRALDGAANSNDLGLPSRINADPQNLEKGLAKLVLTLIELLRRLMERQAIRRMEGGTLCDEEIERLGQAFMKLEQRMHELKETFGLKHEDLNLNLGPLGKLMD